MILPGDVGLLVAAMMIASGIITCLIFDSLLPRESPTYIPKRHRQCQGPAITTILKIINDGLTIVTKVINKVKVRRRRRPPGLYNYSFRPRRKKYRARLQASLTGMTTTWAQDNKVSPGMFDSDSQALMLDDGASACITNDKNDFTEPPRRVDRKVKGIKGHAKATHRGTIKWHLEDDNGLVHVMVITGAYLIPEACTRILSPQHLAQQAEDHYPKAEGTGALTTSKSIVLFWSQRRYSKTVPLDPKTNVGMTTTASGARTFRAFYTTITTPETRQPNIFTTHVIPEEEDDDSFQPPDPIDTDTPEEESLEPVSNETPQVMSPEPKMMSPAPKATLIDMGPVTHVIPEDHEPTSLDPHDELLRWHYRLGHLPFNRIKQLAHKGQLPKRLLACTKPLCAACQYGKMTKRPWRVKGDNKTISKTATRPGQIVSVDQLEANTPGLIAQLKGKLTQQRYKYATVFVDQFSGYTFVYLQKRLTSEETVMAKHAFESSANQRGVKIIHYHADNGRFADNAFIADCKTQHQGLSYCGVNAHFQNGVAERRIRDLQELARTSLLYAMNKWKRMILTCLWPYAIRHANDVSNATPKKGEDLSPLEQFSGVKVAPKLRHFHAFGCPTYVLDNALQGNQGAPKWKHRARLGVYLGPSPNHARSVALILNPRTGHVSPQFHVKFDDFFETVSDKSTDFNAPAPEWKYLSGFAVRKEQARPANSGLLGHLITPRRGPINPSQDLPPHGPTVPPPGLQQDQTDPVGLAEQEPLQEVATPVEQPPATTATQQQADQAPTTARQTRSGRVVRNTSRYEQSLDQRKQGLVAWEIMLDQDDREDIPTAASQYAIQKAQDNPMAFAAIGNPDILYWDQAMKAPDRDKFIEAVGTELEGHERMGNYEPIPLDQVPTGTKLIDMVWSMRRKRKINTQEVYKWKARLNVHGGQQVHGIHFWDTYAPVVTWQTVRLFLILSLILGWQSRQLDFVMAYPQAPAEMPLYMQLPQGYQRKGISRRTHALKLLRNVYGQKQAGRVWNRYMDQGMREIGFKPSAFDQCLYYRGPMVFLVYIDDCIVFGPDNRSIDAVVKDLRACSHGFTVDDQGDIGDFLGIQVQKLSDGSIKLTQPQLIDDIIKDLHLQSGSNTEKTPAVPTQLLHKDTEGAEMTPDFHFRSVIGKLNFLEKSTRPDISVSVHQCARFLEHPKRSHAEAVKRIGRYLLATRDRGLIIRPNEQRLFECWVDADFAGNWLKRDAPVDPMTVKSRSGWIIKFAGAPITWASKMQTITALSTTEAEYIALSTSLREVIPLMGMLKEATEQGLCIAFLPPKIHCTVFEDNSGALELARLPKMRPRTKHINQSFHHFREYVERREIQIQFTPTKKQIADILTKPLPEASFVTHRQSIMGW